MGTKFHDGPTWPTPHDVRIISQPHKRPQLRVCALSSVSITFLREATAKYCQRIFGFLPTLALSSTLLASWEAVGSYVVPDLFAPSLSVLTASTGHSQPA
jgi:hypothetical protein